MCGIFWCITHVEIQAYYMCVVYTCVGYIPVLHMYFYTCNIYVGYTPVLYVWNVCIIGFIYVLIKVYELDV